MRELDLLLKIAVRDKLFLQAYTRVGEATVAQLFQAAEKAIERQRRECGWWDPLAVIDADQRSALAATVADLRCRPVRGFVNCGVTCYVAAALQMLLRAHTLVAPLQATGENVAAGRSARANAFQDRVARARALLSRLGSVIDVATPAMCASVTAPPAVCQALRTLVGQYFNDRALAQSTEALPIEYVKSFVRALTPRHPGGARLHTQGDGFEMLGAALQALNDDGFTWAPATTSLLNAVQRQCKSCGHTTGSRLEVENLVFIKVQSGTVRAGWQEAYAPFTHHDYKCERCGKTNVTKTASVIPSALPMYLFVGVKRYAWTDQAERVAGPMAYPYTWDPVQTLLAAENPLTKTLVKLCPRDTRSTYHLVATMHHCGEISHGHYFAYVRTHVGTWNYCSDHSITAADNGGSDRTVVGLLFERKPSI